MGLIREPLEVDFVVNPKPLSADEKIAISEFIKADKAKRNRMKFLKTASPAIARINAIQK